MTSILSFILEFRTLELFIAAFIFISIHSIQKRAALGLPSWPIVGMLPSLILGLRGNIYDWITDILNNRGGTFTFSGSWLTSLEAVITSDPRNLEHLLKTKFTNFPKGPYFRTAVQDLLGEGIFGADDEAWKRQRRTASLEFHSPSFRAMTTKSIYTLVHSRLLPILESACKDRSQLDLQDVLLRLTFDNVCIIAFGTDPGCLSPGLPDIPFACAFEDATEATIVRFITPTTIWKVCKFLDVGNERWLRKSLEDVNEFAYSVIKNRRVELESNVKERSDLLTIFMRLKDEEGKRYSKKFLRDICVNFILAGRDTSSVALAWFFWLLEKNNEVELKIVDEIDKIVKGRGDSDNYDDGNIVFKPEEIKKMEYLQAALSEALRLYPSVPVRKR